MKIICPNLKNKEVAREFEELKNYFQKPKGLSRKVCK